MTVIGIQDGFRGLIENRTMLLEPTNVSGILTRGGTILGTSRDKPHKMPMGGKFRNMIPVAVENVKRHHIDCLVCLGGGGTLKNALRLHTEGGINVMNLPKTIDNDVDGTDVTFGYDTAMQIATEAIDRLHTTATSHHRIIVCEIMGHRAGWLTLNAGIAGGADVILIPEIPYDLDVISQYLLERLHRRSTDAGRRSIQTR
jgi:6-phosphofructokinase 1